MITTFIIIFWISLAILFYCYIGYGILVFFLVGLKQIFLRNKKTRIENILPVTLIVTAYNEEKILEQKITNTLAIDYPSDQLNIIFITDGSTDDSRQIIQRYPAIISLHQPERRGKYAAIKRAMRQVQTPVVVFSD